MIRVRGDTRERQGPDMNWDIIAGSVEPNLVTGSKHCCPLFYALFVINRLICRDACHIAAWCAVLVWPI